MCIEESFETIFNMGYGGGRTTPPSPCVMCRENRPYPRGLRIAVNFVAPMYSLSLLAWVLFSTRLEKEVWGVAGKGPEAGTRESQRCQMEGLGTKGG